MLILRVRVSNLLSVDPGIELRVRVRVKAAPLRESDKGGEASNPQIDSASVLQRGSAKELGLAGLGLEWLGSEWLGREGLGLEWLGLGREGLGREGLGSGGWGQG